MYIRETKSGLRVRRPSLDAGRCASGSAERAVMQTVSLRELQAEHERLSNSAAHTGVGMKKKEAPSPPLVRARRDQQKQKERVESARDTSQENLTLFRGLSKGQRNLAAILRIVGYGLCTVTRGFMAI